MHDIYKAGSAILGPLQNKQRLEFKATTTTAERITLIAFLIVMLFSGFSFAGLLILAVMMQASIAMPILIAVAGILIGEIIRILQSLTLWIFAYRAKDPIPMVPGQNLRIAVLTTIVPGKEPMELVARTLAKMKQLESGQNNMVDVWLLDEGNDPAVKAECEALGVKHFSRKGVAEWNTLSGEFKARTKHGNHNAWRSLHEKDYDVVAQMDPDHSPHKDFLLRTLGYFSDPEVAFVVAPQVYGNLKDNWIARGSAFQAYVFHGIIQRGGNALNAPLLIGTNHLYRTSAFKSIHGYQDSIIEDHLTSMVIYGATSSEGKKWRGVYTPDILAVGEGPTTFTDYFNQQKRWAYGIWEIALKSSPKVLKRLTAEQKLTFAMLQFFYPSVAISWVLSSLITFLFSKVAFAAGDLAMPLMIAWACSIFTSLWFFFWLRRFNLIEHERKDWGLQGLSLLLMCIPVYTSAAWEALRGKPLTYAVTAKGDLASPDTLKTFAPHGWWIAINIALLYLLLTSQTLTSIGWTIEHLALCLMPIAVYVFTKYKSILSVPIRFNFGFNGDESRAKNI